MARNVPADNAQIVAILEVKCAIIIRAREVIEMKPSQQEIEALKRDLRAIQTDLKAHVGHTRRIQQATRLVAHAVQRLAKPDTAARAERRV